MRGPWRYCVGLILLYLLIAPSVHARTAPVVKLLQELIQADTTNPPGEEIRATLVLQQWLKTSQKITVEVLESAPRRANLIARLSGTGEAKPLILLAHTDVVPADPADWAHPPYEGKVMAEKVWGRGAIDMKGMLAMETIALLELAEQDKALAGDVILVATADEESGGHYGLEWLLTKRPDLLKAGAVLNEGSIGIKREEFDLFPIQVAEKGVCWLKLTARGEPGHGSMPHDNNAVLHLSRAIEKIGRYRFPLQETVIMKRFTQTIAPHFSFPESLALQYLFTPIIGTPLRWLARTALASDQAMLAMLADTASPTRLAAGNKTNVIPSRAIAYVDARLLPGKSPETFRDFLQGLVGDDVSLEIVMQSAANQSPLDTALYNSFAKVLQQHFPEAVIAPVMSAGATDSRFFRAAGIPAYGLIPALIEREELKGLHGINERISIQGLTQGVIILKEVISDYFMEH